VTKNQDFFRTDVQIQGFSGSDFSFFIFQDFSGPVGTLLLILLNDATFNDFGPLVISSDRQDVAVCLLFSNFFSD